MLNEAATLSAIRKHFNWGTILDIHNVGDIFVVEYAEKRIANHPTLEGRILFHTYLGSKDQSASYESLDSALIGAIASKRIGFTAGTYAARFFDDMTGVKAA
jgi:hypothetical protein